MKPLCLTLAIACSAALTPAQDSPSLAGKWQVHQTIADNDSDMTCSFTESGADLAGTCEGDDHTTVKVTGKVDGAKVSWVYKSEYNGGPVTLTYKGNAGSADKITGTVDVLEYGADGEFTATRAK